MTNKTLRILIADEHPSQRLQLERLLNGLGYYRIAPVECFDELQRLVHCALQPFNLLLGNIELASHCLLYTSPSPRDGLLSRMPSSA